MKRLEIDIDTSKEINKLISEIIYITTDFVQREFYSLVFEGKCFEKFKEEMKDFWTRKKIEDKFKLLFDRIDILNDIRMFAHNFWIYPHSKHYIASFTIFGKKSHLTNLIDKLFTYPEDFKGVEEHLYYFNSLIYGGKKENIKGGIKELVICDKNLADEIRDFYREERQVIIDFEIDAMRKSIVESSIFTEMIKKVNANNLFEYLQKLRQVSKVQEEFNEENIKALASKLKEAYGHVEPLHEFVNTVDKLINNILLLILLDCSKLGSNRSWQILNFIPCDSYGKMALGGTVVLLRSFKNPFLLVTLKLIINQMMNCMALVYSDKKWRDNALRQAIAAIMARNMSHNIGSHVLAYLKSELDIHKGKPENPLKALDADMGLLSRRKDLYPEALRGYFISLKEMIEYLKDRMDFIAVAQTYVPSCSTMNLRNDFEKKLNFDLKYEDLEGYQFIKWQNFLLSYIAKSDKIGEMAITREKMNVVFNEHKAWGRTCVSIPGGNIGRQAFFSILENIIRNSAKHGTVTTLKNELKIKIDMPDVPDIESKNERKKSENKNLNYNDLCYNYHNYVKITITDNLGTANDDLIRKLNSALQGDLIDAVGRLERKNLGIKEMKIGAAFLRGCAPELINKNRIDDKEPELLEVGQDSDNNLQYSFYLLKPKEILVITKNKDVWSQLDASECRIEGIEVKSPNDILISERARHRFCIIDVDVDPKTDLRKPQALPLRQLSLLKDLKDKRVLVLIGDNERCVRIKKAGNLAEFLKYVYKVWIKTNFDTPQLPPLVIELNAATLHYSWQKWPKENSEAIFLSCVKFQEEQEKLQKEKKKKGGILFYDHFNVSKLKKDDYSDVSKFKEQEKRPIDESKYEYIESITGHNSSRSKFQNQNLNSSTWFHELIEAALTKICIVDERIYNIAGRQGNKDLELKGLRILDLKYSKEGFQFIDLNNNVHVTIRQEGGTNYSIIKGGNGENKLDYHFFTIHQGIVDKIITMGKGKDERLIDNLFKAFKDSKLAEHFLIHSGRGKPDYFPKGVFFLSYGELENWFYEDKHTMVQGFFNQRG